MFATYFENLRRFLKRSGGPLLFAWMACYVIIRFAGELLTPSGIKLLGSSPLVELGPELLEQDQNTLMIAVLVFLVVSALQEALVRPARALMREQRKPGSLWQVVALALPELPAVIAVQVFQLFCLLGLVALGALLEVQLLVIVQMTAATMLFPLMYITVGQGYDVRRAIARSVVVAKQNFATFFSFQGTLIVGGMLLNGVLQRDLGLPWFVGESLTLGYSYLCWAATIALMLTVVDVDKE